LLCRVSNKEVKNMYVVCVTVFVKPEKIKEFKEEIFENARK